MRGMFVCNFPSANRRPSTKFYMANLTKSTELTKYANLKKLRNKSIDRLS